MMAERWRGMRKIREQANAEAWFDRDLDRVIRAAEGEQAAQRQQQEEGGATGTGGERGA